MAAHDARLRRYVGDASVSKDQFERLAKDQVLQWLGGGELYPTESEGCPTCAILDQHACVDYVHVAVSGVVHALAVRMQPDDNRTGWPYNTFTLRDERFNGYLAEYTKLMRAKRSSGIAPHFHIQGYVASNDSLQTLGMAETTDVLTAVKVYGRKKSTSNAVFYIVDWRNLQKISRMWIFDRGDDALIDLEALQQ